MKRDALQTWFLWSIILADGILMSDMSLAISSLSEMPSNHISYIRQTKCLGKKICSKMSQKVFDLMCTFNEGESD